MKNKIKYECERKNCVYHPKMKGNTCDYYLITGKRRGCSVMECDKYKRKKKI